MIMKIYHSTRNKKILRTRGIMTISAMASVLSLPLVDYIHKSQMQRRMMMNLNYDGEYGGEILIPALILFIGVFISLEIERRKYEKYNKYRNY